MNRILATGIGTILVLALVSAIVMVANAPASTRTSHGNPFAISAADAAHPNSVGRLTISFEPIDQAVDRD